MIYALALFGMSIEEVHMSGILVNVAACTGAFGFHRGPVERTDIVRVDIDREPVETEVKEVERRPTLEDETIRQDPIPRDLLQQVQKPQHLF